MLASLKQAAGTDAFFDRSMARCEAIPAEPPLPMKMTRPPRARRLQPDFAGGGDLRDNSVVDR